MYHIRYLDPMTGTVLEAQSHALDEAVAFIKKAKDNLYFKGYPSPQEEVAAVDSDHLLNESAENPKIDSEYETESPSIEDEDYWYPYGVALW